MDSPATSPGNPTSPAVTDDEHTELRRKLELQERPGFETIFVPVAFKKKARLGLVIRNYEKCVMVSKLDPGSLCAEKLMVGDHLVAVNTDFVWDRETAKQLILRGFSKKRRVTLVIQRPQSSEAKLWAKTAILSNSTRTSSTAPREKHKWAKMAAEQRQAARLLQLQENQRQPDESSGAITVKGSTPSQSGQP